MSVGLRAHRPLRGDNEGMNRPARHAISSIALAAAGVLVIAGCSSGQSDQTAPASPAPSTTSSASPSAEGAQTILAAQGLAGLDARQVVDRLDATKVADRPRDLMASVRPAGLVLRQGGGEQAEVAIPDGQFYLSIAPYLNKTHECHFHSLTTCLGELRNEPVHLKITRADTGAVLVDKDTTTFDNGFVAAWVPRDITANVTITHGGKSATSTVTTGSQDATCLTTMRLA